MRAEIEKLPGVFSSVVHLREKELEIRFLPGAVTAPDALAAAVKRAGFAVGPMKLVARGDIVMGEKGAEFVLSPTPLSFRAAGPADRARAAKDVIVSGTLYPPFRAHARLELREVKPLQPGPRGD